ncbi:nucleotidyltransferase domain-containing protein [Salinicola sp. JS01]|uniref:type VII toxin-antitoxin system MntA family adenylyltransferase antitoxin n=1 Tax=Salinicola sp. JS01 TaxID=3050071 RepID=UPI00255C065C|nr:nucleotidyltransferase domain-containing protein [Salinicola sp. JS01]WIX32413.1 nucleotidyltransferase domain-containing protein [Salinicola sp. JS01]
MQAKIDQAAVVRTLQGALGQRLLAIYAFGSQISGQARADSDLDLAVLLSGTADSVALWTLAQDIAAMLDIDVDLVDLRKASTVMQYRVVTSGERWWSRDEQAGLFEAFVLSDKMALDEARAPLMADIQREGRIHGR